MYTTVAGRWKTAPKPAVVAAVAAAWHGTFADSIATAAAAQHAPYLYIPAITYLIPIPTYLHTIL